MDFSAFSDLLISQWGYLGILFVQLISSSTVLLPLPGIAVVFLYGAVLNPLIVGLFAATGSALGELTGYAVGYGGHRLIISKNRGISKKVRSLFHKYNPFLVIIFFTIIPF